MRTTTNKTTCQYIGFHANYNRLFLVAIHSLRRLQGAYKTIEYGLSTEASSGNNLQGHKHTRRRQSEKAQPIVDNAFDFFMHTLCKQHRTFFT